MKTFNVFTAIFVVFRCISHFSTYPGDSWSMLRLWRLHLQDLLRGASWPSVGFGSPSLCTA